MAIDPIRPIPELFIPILEMKEVDLVEKYISLRNLMFTLAPDCHELTYNTHAMSSVFSHTKKLSNAFCHIPVYTNHLNLGFNKGALLNDPERRLQGSGKLIRHIPISGDEDFENNYVRILIIEAMEKARN